MDTKKDSALLQQLPQRRLEGDTAGKSGPPSPGGKGGASGSEVLTIGGGGGGGGKGSGEEGVESGVVLAGAKEEP